MACINPIRIPNKKYLPNKENGGSPPLPDDIRDLGLIVPCGKCIECRRRRASDWRFRLLQEYKYNKSKFWFVTFTFSDDALLSLYNDPEFARKCFYKGIEEPSENDLYIFAVRRFLERYRKKYKTSLPHLFVSELGGETDRLHLHGIVWDLKPEVKYTGKNRKSRKNGQLYKIFESSVLADLWKYGFITIEPCSEVTIGYILKYIMKYDPKHPEWESRLLVSPGLGKCYVNDRTIAIHHSTGFDRYEWFCVTSSGHKIGMPRYYRLKIFTDEERERRKRAMWDDPPPLYFRGQLYEDEFVYRQVVKEYMRYTERLGLSKRKERVYRRNDIIESIEFGF